MSGGSPRPWTGVAPAPHPDPFRTPSNTEIIAIWLVFAAGFLLSISVFYPGYMTIDALWVYEATARGLGDWQSPVMTLLWKLIDPIAPGSMSMFLLMAALYWGSFALIALAVTRRVPWLGVAVMLLAMSPPAFILVGMIWRDVLFADVWLCAAALTYTGGHSRARAPLAGADTGVAARWLRRAAAAQCHYRRAALSHVRPLAGGIPLETDDPAPGTGNYRRLCAEFMPSTTQC